MSDIIEVLKAYLDKRAAEDELFAKSYAKPNKSIDECVKYIEGEAYKHAKGNKAFLTDDTVYGWAVHYYDEDDIKINPVKGAVRSSAPKVDYKPTEADMEAAKAAAMRKLEEEAYKKLTTPKKAKKDPAADCPTQMSLFS